MARNFTVEELAGQYIELWTSAKFTRNAQIQEAARKIIRNRDAYDQLEKELGVPWFWIGAIHMRESSNNFYTHLHNGDPLTARTRHVPKGRPIEAPANGTKYTWFESARDALRQKGLQNVSEWDIPRLCYEAERYNGWGYRYSKSRPLSPYLWAGTQHYNRGKYVADGRYSSTTVDPQLGVIPVMQAVLEITTARKVPGSRTGWWNNVLKWFGLSGLSIPAMLDQVNGWAEKNVWLLVGIMTAGAGAMAVGWYLEHRKLTEYKEGRYMPSKQEWSEEELVD